MKIILDSGKKGTKPTIIQTCESRFAYDVLRPICKVLEEKDFGYTSKEINSALISLVK